MKIYIEAKEVNVRITDNDNKEVFTYSTATYNVVMNVTMFITMAVGLIKHMMGLEAKSKVETSVATTAGMPAFGEVYYIVNVSGITCESWDNDTNDLRNWQNGIAFSNFDTAAIEYKARHCV